jgi:hypothetical protein
MNTPYNWVDMQPDIIHKHRSRCFGIMEGHDLFFNVGHIV